jgi:hypothetical protein
MALAPWSPNRRSFVLGLASAALFTLASCNQQLHEHAGVLLEALASGDYRAALAVSGPQLREELDGDRFAQISAAYGMLGALESRTRTGAGIHDGDARSLDYTLEFETGDVLLNVVSSGDTLDGFEFEGKAWENAGKSLRKQRLDALLDAIARKDVAAARALCHASVSDVDVEKLVAQLAPLGTAREAVYVGGEGGRIEVQFETGKRVGDLWMRGGKISGFSLAAT